MSTMPFGDFLLTSNKLFDIRWKLVKQFGKIVYYVSSTLDQGWLFSRKDGRK